MTLTAGEREITLEFKSLKMEQLGDKLKGDTYLKLQEAAFDNSIKTLVLLIQHFSEDFKGIKTGDEKDPYGFIDQLQADGNSINDIYKAIFDGINEKGFFTQKLDPNSPPLDMKRITTQMTERMSAEMLESMASSRIGESMQGITAG